MKLLRFALAALLSALTSSVGVAASFSTDQSDLWWADPPKSEDGWGFQLVQRNSTIFITMFVYGPTGAPTWYVSTMAPTGTPFQWSGDLYTTTGPWFGTVPYNPALFTFRRVGPVTWTANTAVTGVLSYTVDGVAVSKNATRQTLVAENYSGHFAGALHQDTTSCGARNGTFEQAGIVNVVQNGTNVTITTAVPGGTCAYAGTLAQYGQMGQIVGSFSCSDGSGGSFNAFELQVTEFSMTGRFTASYTVPAGCQASGWFGGLTVTTF